MRTKIENLNEQTPIVIAEYRLLNALYLNSEYFLETGVERDLFVHDVCKDIFDAMYYLHTEKIPLTKNAIFQNASGRNINVTAESIQGIININSDKDVVLKDIIKTLSDANRSIVALNNIRKVESIVNENPLRTNEQNDKIRNLLTDTERNLLSENDIKRIKTFPEVEESYKENYEERKNGKQFKFYDVLLDKVITYGPAPGSGGIIAASTGMGKSAWCLNLIDRLVAFQIPCMYYSLEMGEIDTFDRWIASRKRIPLKDIVSPTPDNFIDIKRSVNEEFTTLKENTRFRFSECASVSLSQVRQDITKFQLDIGQTYCVVVFDLLSMIKEFTIVEKGMNFAQGIEVAINTLNAMAKELGFHYIAVLQLNRKVEDQQVLIDDLDDLKRFRPTRNSIKNANAFMERVRYALGLFRPKYFAKMFIEDTALWEDIPDYCEVFSLKQNSGEVGLIGKYLFEPEIMKMTPVEEEIASEESVG